MFQILIASPGDVQAEREIIVEVIHEWNYLNSREKRIVLLPLRWETHSSPELGERAQGVINRQVVDHCDMAVGVFWTRMGTPTSAAESGTAEEVERVGRAGKPVMIYFSRAKVDLESVDLEEYARLREFKEKTYPLGLIEKYETPLQFRDKFSRQLAMKVRELITENAVSESTDASDQDGDVLTLRLAQGDPPEVLPRAAVVEVERSVCVDEDRIPDFVITREPEDSGDLSISARANPDYYREMVRYHRERDAYRSFRIAIENLDVRGWQNLLLELVVAAKSGTARIVDHEPAVKRPVDSTFAAGTIQSGDVMGSVIMHWNEPTQHLQLTQDAEGTWRMELSVPVVQAKRTVFSRNQFWVDVTEPCVVELMCTAYSANSDPRTLRASLEIKVNHHEMSYREILADLGVQL
ncbi:hypothetical protein AB0I53_40325 [Saccharopolyspora sp. NPDC050389]|uniref:hypothetical protein n=1 Tax=Saccharopolyspora sp. NPDC050389 TaxID=3155516 RepID=UPI003409EF1F